MTTTTILAVDPGLARTGYALLNVNQSKNSVLDFGCLETSKDEITTHRLQKIYQLILKLMKKYEPDILVIEQLFFNKNVKTAIMVGQAQGAILLAASKMNIDSVWYTPGEVKQAVCGYGAASKLQVQIMVQKIMGLAEIPQPDDAADALALAICHSATVNISSQIKKVS